MLLLTGWLEVVTKVNVKAVINLTTVGGNITADEWLVFSAYVIDVGVETATGRYRNTQYVHPGIVLITRFIGNDTMVIIEG